LLIYQGFGQTLDQESGAQIGDNWRNDKYDEEVWTMALSPDAVRQLPLEAGTGL